MTLFCSGCSAARRRAATGIIHVFLRGIKTWMAGTSPAMTTEQVLAPRAYYPSPASLASTPLTARAQPFSLRSRVAALMFGLKRCSRRQLSANFEGSG